MRQVLRVTILFGLGAAACAVSPAEETATTDLALAGDFDAAGETQRPPTSSAEAIDAWLAAGHYRQWTCEAIRPSRPPGGTAPMRLCSNAAMSGHGAGEYPIGATNVREIYDASGARMVTRAVTTKVATGSGNAWYWFERRESGLVASGLGDSGPATRACVRCHERAQPSLFGHDLVFHQAR